MSDSTIFPRPASSVVMIREGSADLEVLMVERPPRGFFGGLMVFPGGAVEDCDVELASTLDDQHRVAAVRETAEEVGILITGAAPRPSPAARGATLLAEVGADRVRAAASQLILISRWITPSSAPKRYDTWFFLAGVDGDPEITLDREELVGHCWVTPRNALRRLEAGDWNMILPTVSHLRWLSRFSSRADAEMAASGTDGLTIIEPVTLADGTLSARYRGES